MADGDAPTLPLGDAGGGEELFDGRYRLLRLLGRGGFGEVRLVEDTLQGDERLALKLILPERAQAREFEQRFRNEIRVLRALQHEGIPQIYNDGRAADGAFYFTMAYVEGRSLDAVLREEGTLAPLRVARIVRQLVGILEYAHARGVVHRDLKPGNVLLVDEGGEGERVRVLDFGIAKLLQREGGLSLALTVDTLGPIGTPHYMSPEQVRGQEIDGSSDYYSLGVLIYHMVSGSYPFRGASAPEVLTARLSEPPAPLPDPDTPRWLARLVEALLARERERRPRGAEVTAALEPALAEIRAEQRRARRWLSASTGALFLLAFLALLAAAAFYAQHPRADAEREPREERDASSAALPAAAPEMEPAPPEDPPSTTRDRRPPALELSTLPGIEHPHLPGTRLVGRGPLRVVGSAGDAGGLSIVELFVGGEPVPLDAAGRFELELSLPSEGSARIPVRATDETGNVATLELSLTADWTAPEILLLAPAPEGLRTRSERARLELAVREPHLASLHLDDSPLEVDADGRATAVIDLSAVGPRTVRIVAVDLAGNRSEREIALERLPLPPELTEHSPEDGSAFAAATARVEIRGESSRPLAAATVNGTAAIVEGRSFRAELELEFGSNRVEALLTAEDGGVSAPAAWILVRSHPRLPPGCEPAAGSALRGEHYAELRHLASGMLLVLVDPCRIELDGRTFALEAPIYVGKHEVTRGAALRAPEAFGEERADLRPPAAGSAAESTFARLPLTQVSHEEAKSFCRQSGLRLPTESEWLCAARGPANHDYPWGASWREGACHSSLEAASTAAARPVDDPAFADGRSWCGAWNLAGNVSEWTAEGWILGGSYQLHPDRCRLLPANRQHIPTRLASLGFRVALDAP